MAGASIRLQPPGLASQNPPSNTHLRRAPGCDGGRVLAAQDGSIPNAARALLNLPTSVVITGCDNMERLQQALEAARTFQPLTDAQLSALLAKTRDAALTGKLEPFKTTSQFDGTAQNLSWMG